MSNEVRARLTLLKLPEGLVGTARVARASYWASIGSPDHAQQEPSGVSLLAWCRVVTRIQFSAIMASLDTCDSINEEGREELLLLASDLPTLIDRASR